jgi:hypothetical protein
MNLAADWHKVSIYTAWLQAIGQARERSWFSIGDVQTHFQLLTKAHATSANIGVFSIPDWLS